MPALLNELWLLSSPTYECGVLLKVWLRVLKVMDEYGGEAGSHPGADVQEKERQEADELLQKCRLSPHLSITAPSLPL